MNILNERTRRGVRKMDEDEGGEQTKGKWTSGEKAVQFAEALHRHPRLVLSCFWGESRKYTRTD